NLYEAGDYTFSTQTITVPVLAFGRSHPGPFDVIDYNWPDSRWFTDNVRNTFWLVQKDTDNPLENHSELLEQ
ncbi:MAG: hypothetical protein J6Q12_05990, partial [Bacteroidales bacterium]|nr:hypothetical protein [Bacteroidales bacterium]